MSDKVLLPPPTAEPMDEPTIQLCVNTEWAGYLIGMIRQATHPGYWAGNLEENRNARRGVQLIMDLLSNTKGCEDMSNCCDGSDLLIIVQTRITIDGRIEISIDGGNTWTSSPTDPMYSIPVQPPPVTEGGTLTKCDAATNGKQHIQDLIAGISLNLQDAVTIFEFAVAIAGIILEIAIVIITGGVTIPAALQIAAIIWGAATAAFNAGKAAFDEYWTTDETDKILCALFCTIGENGSFTQAQYDAFVLKWRQDATPSIAFNLVLKSVQAAGLVGLNNYCSYGAAADSDCSDCDCNEGCNMDDWKAGFNYQGTNQFHGGDTEDSRTASTLTVHSFDRGDGTQITAITLPLNTTACCYVTIDHQTGGDDQGQIYQPCFCDEVPTYENVHPSGLYPTQNIRSMIIQGHATPFTTTFSIVAAH